MSDNQYQIAAVAQFMNTNPQFRKEAETFWKRHKSHMEPQPNLNALVDALTHADQAKVADGITSLVEVDTYFTESALRKDADAKNHNPYILSMVKLGIERFAKHARTPVVFNHANHVGRTLRNSHIVMRHGESIPSNAKIVCGDPAVCVRAENTLTVDGWRETENSARAWMGGNADLEAKLKAGKVLIVTSPCSRTKETAKILADEIQTRFNIRPQERVELALRERFFGEFEGHNNSGGLYTTAWEGDERDPGSTVGGVESANYVAERASEVIERYEKEHDGYTIIYVAHGDTLKILETAVRGLSPSKHQDDACKPEGANCVKPYKTAEIRGLNPAFAARRGNASK